MNREIATKTLAQLYLRQGDPQKALEIYLKILRQEPENAEIREAIQDLRRGIADGSFESPDHSGKRARTEKIQNLERWRKNIRTIRERRKGPEKD